MQEQDNLYTEVRAVKVPTIQIEQIEQQFGAKLVPDTEFITLLALDEALIKYRKSHDGKDPDVIILREHPEYMYKHMVLNIQFLGTEIPGSRNKPAWFKFKKFF